MYNHPLSPPFKGIPINVEAINKSEKNNIVAMASEDFTTTSSGFSKKLG